MCNVMIQNYQGKDELLLQTCFLKRGGHNTSCGKSSIMIVGLVSQEVSSFSSVLILMSALIGVVLFQNAPKVANRIFPKKPKGQST